MDGTESEHFAKYRKEYMLLKEWGVDPLQAKKSKNWECTTESCIYHGRRDDPDWQQHIVGFRRTEELTETGIAKGIFVIQCPLCSHWFWFHCLWESAFLAAEECPNWPK